MSTKHVEVRMVLHALGGKLAETSGDLTPHFSSALFAL